MAPRSSAESDSDDGASTKREPETPRLRSRTQAKASFIDVDRTILEPSPLRIRNILTLEERVRAIQAYDFRPMYTKVAKMFNCSWEQIKNIINNREAILGFYEATKNSKNQNNPTQDELRQKKIAFLGECMYEYIQRAQFHTKADLTEELIRMKAFAFCDIMRIENFTPNKVWINHFKATYNFSLSNRQITLTRVPPSSLYLKDIITYCTKHKAKAESPAMVQPRVHNLYRTTTKMAVSSANDATLEELNQRRQHKVKLLELSLAEYMRRYQFYQKAGTTLSEAIIRKAAMELRDLLDLKDQFIPNRPWYNNFLNTYKVTLSGAANHQSTPPNSLDLQRILSYCSQRESKLSHDALSTPDSMLPPSNSGPGVAAKRSAPNATPTTSRTPITRQQTSGAKTAEPSALNNSTAAATTTTTTVSIKEEIIDLDNDEEDIKPNIVELEKSTVDADCQPPPLKIKKIETINEPQTVHSPGHWSEHSSDDEEAGEPLPKHVRNYTDALKLLKPLEEFAMLEENYRVIGLIGQLEEIFTNSHTLKK